MITRRILLLVTDLELGGTPTVVRELSLRLYKTVPELHVEVACLASWGPVATQLVNMGLPVTALGASGRLDLRIVPRLIHLLRLKQINTVFSFLIHANVIAAVASLWVRDVRWIQSIQTTQPSPRWHWLLQRLVHRAADTVVVPSPSVALCARVWAHVPPDKILVIPNAVDLADFEDAKSRVPLDNPRPYPIAFIGRLDPIKDVPTLIEAVGRLHRLVCLDIYGQGIDRKRIEGEVAVRGLGQFVTLRGAIDRPQNALMTSGMLVLPSLAEGFGLVLIEAMAAGIPVVATNAPGIRDVIRPNETGLLVPSSNPGALAVAIKQVIDDIELRRRLIDNAARDVCCRFTWDIVLDQYRRLLQV